jgi:hypothetical protein
VRADLGRRVSLQETGEAPGEAGADPLVKGFGRAGQPDSILVAILPCRQERQTLECEGDPRWVFDLAEQLQRFEGGGPGVTPAVHASVGDGQPDQIIGELHHRQRWAVLVHP